MKNYFDQIWFHTFQDLQRFPMFQPIGIHGGHLRHWSRSQDTILKDKHPRGITSMFDLIWQIGS